MRNRWFVMLISLTGCPMTMPSSNLDTQQVTAMPFADPGQPAPTRVNYAPASQETCERVWLVRDKLVGKYLACGLRPNVTAVAAADPEIFHVGLNQIYITEGLVKQCPTDSLLAAVLANEVGRMVSEREAAVSDEVRQPERLPPIELPIGSNGNWRDRDPVHEVEMARFEKAHPKQTKKLPPPNPQAIARDLLEKTGFQSTDLDAALPILQNAARFQSLENQFKGNAKQSDWKQP